MLKAAIFLIALVLAILKVDAVHAECMPGDALCPTYKIVATAPTGTFFENIALGPDNTFYITDYTGKRIVSFSEAAGLKTYASTPIHPLGIEVDRDGTVYFGGQEKTLFDGGGSFYNANLVYRIKKGAAPERFLEIKEAKFLNGMLWLRPGQLLIADSRGGVVWKLDTSSAVASKYLNDPVLDATNQSLPTPAANGVKINDGYLYISNTADGVILRTKLDAQKNPGALEVFLKLRADDFAFSPRGTLYLTTHRDKINRVVSGEVKEFAGGGTGIVGNTALAWDANGKGPFVIGDGGLVGSVSYKAGPPSEATIVKFDTAD